MTERLVLYRVPTEVRAAREASGGHIPPPMVEDRAMPKESHEVTLFSGTALARDRSTWVTHSAPIFHEVPITAKSPLLPAEQNELSANAGITKKAAK